MNNAPQEVQTTLPPTTAEPVATPMASTAPVATAEVPNTPAETAPTPPVTGEVINPPHVGKPAEGTPETPAPAQVIVQEDPEIAEAEKKLRMRIALSPTAEQVKARNLAFMDPVRLNTMTTLAQSFVQSGAFPASLTPQRALVALQAGYERGMQPIEALNSFYFVNGHISMYGDTVIAMIMEAGHQVLWGLCNAETATVTITRGDNGQSMSATMTMKMAMERGLAKAKGAMKDTYLQHPESMLKYKAVGLIAKFIAPDALRGISIKEDIETEVVEEEQVPKHAVQVTGTATPVRVVRRTMKEALSTSKQPNPPAAAYNEESKKKEKKEPAKSGQTPLV